MGAVAVDIGAGDSCAVAVCSESLAVYLDVFDEEVVAAVAAVEVDFEVVDGAGVGVCVCSPACGDVPVSNGLVVDSEFHVFTADISASTNR